MSSWKIATNPLAREVGRQRGSCRQDLFRRPLPEPSVQALLHTALQCRDDLQHGYGVLHLAYPTVPVDLLTPVSLRPVLRLSRIPWPVVTPATTTDTPWPWGSRPVGHPEFPLRW